MRPAFDHSAWLTPPTRRRGSARLANFRRALALFVLRRLLSLTLNLSRRFRRML